ncbi:hypothetical protein DIREPILLOW8_202 [Vibrio phage Direpillow8]|nr:hypothetical protein DIREPILLOW8_202 [Vibrio phage Direpillow8]
MEKKVTLKIGREYLLNTHAIVRVEKLTPAGIIVSGLGRGREVLSPAKFLNSSCLEECLDTEHTYTVNESEKPVQA